MAIKVYSFTLTAANVMNHRIRLGAKDVYINNILDEIEKTLFIYHEVSVPSEIIRGLLLALLIYSRRRIEYPTENYQIDYDATMVVLSRDKLVSTTDKETDKSRALQTVSGYYDYSYRLYGSNKIVSFPTRNDKVMAFADRYYSYLLGEQHNIKFWTKNGKCFCQNPVLYAFSGFIEDVFILLDEKMLYQKQAKQYLYTVFMPIYKILCEYYSVYELKPLLKSKDDLSVDWEKIEKSFAQEKNNEQGSDKTDNILFCRKCGKRIPINSNFCQYCGTKL